MGLASRNKGKRGEREAVLYLKKLGFDDARRTQQFKGTGDSSDVTCENSIPNAFIEVKFGYNRAAIDIGTKGLQDALERAKADCGKKWACVLWRPSGAKQWRLTYESADRLTITLGRDSDIHYALRVMPINRLVG